MPPLWAYTSVSDVVVPIGWELSGRLEAWLVGRYRGVLRQGKPCVFETDALPNFLGKAKKKLSLITKRAKGVSLADLLSRSPKLVRQGVIADLTLLV